ncbi:hypothetical protein [Streptomyces sp. Ag109_O5-1]|uniref:hypothetical protein n=1 Tax=Streptomyces sp. Ag109_O5-1 TaxID=1938851 RepID=UPI000F4EDDD6|nr:hypothetical protein [Streptomyces sp. Ag109_O5-1]
MSNSAAAAVLTTTDLTEAIRAVRTLLSKADIDQAEVDFEAVIRSPQVLAQVLHVLPDLRWWASAGEEHGSSEAGDDPADCLPIRVFDWGRPLDRAEPFVAALGQIPRRFGGIWTHGLRFPKQDWRRSRRSTRTSR